MLERQCGARELVGFQHQELATDSAVVNVRQRDVRSSKQISFWVKRKGEKWNRAGTEAGFIKSVLSRSCPTGGGAVLLGKKTDR